MVPPPLPPTLPYEGGRDHLMDKSSLLRVPEGRATYLNMGALPSLADDDDDGDGKNSRGRGGG